MAVMEIEHEVEKKEREAEIHRLRNVELSREIEERKKAQRTLREGGAGADRQRWRRPQR